MAVAAWPSVGGHEYALVFGKDREKRLLVLPALFDEANKTRHLIAETMRRLAASGIDSFLPDLPGWNESSVPYARNPGTLGDWRTAAKAAAKHFDGDPCAHDPCWCDPRPANAARLALCPHRWSERAAGLASRAGDLGARGGRRCDN